MSTTYKALSLKYRGMVLLLEVRSKYSRQVNNASPFGNGSLNVHGGLAPLIGARLSQDDGPADSCNGNNHCAYVLQGIILFCVGLTISLEEISTETVKVCGNKDVLVAWSPEEKLRTKLKGHFRRRLASMFRLGLEDN